MSASDFPCLWNGDRLTDLLPLRDLGDGLWASAASDDNFNRRVFGGQLLGQALWAAAQTVPPDRRAHMLQVSFLRGAAFDRPLTYRVQNLLDGSRYSSRHVRAMQGETAVLDAQASFQVAADSPLQHQIDADDVPDPEQLADTIDLFQQAAAASDIGTIPLVSKRCVEMRAVDPQHLLFGASERPRAQFWLRLRQRLPDSPALHDAALAYLTDYLVNCCTYIRHTPLTRFRELYVASLNHGLWFHENARCDDWLLFDCESPASGHGRGLAVMRIYDRGRRLVASATQQCTLGPRQASERS